MILKYFLGFRTSKLKNGTHIGSLCRSSVRRSRPFISGTRGGIEFKFKTDISLRALEAVRKSKF